MKLREPGENPETIENKAKAKGKKKIKFLTLLQKATTTKLRATRKERKVQ